MPVRPSALATIGTVPVPANGSSTTPGVDGAELSEQAQAKPVIVAAVLPSLSYWPDKLC